MKRSVGLQETLAVLGEMHRIHSLLERGDARGRCFGARFDRRLTFESMTHRNERLESHLLKDEPQE